MLISHKWLQSYFKDPLPDAEKLADLLTFHVFEIEGIEKKGDDSVIDVKVLPDRARYGLSHRGIAYEVSAITELAVNEKGFGADFSSLKKGEVTSDKTVRIDNQEPDLCVRYSARFIEGVTVGESPTWLKDSLTAIGQRSINTVVDATNFVMFDVGQPLHAFDADSVKGGITVRKAKAGETITTLDGKEITLDETILVIADDEGPLAIAGVRGGNRAGVTEATKNIIIESATFDAGMVRKTSQKIGIRTDSSKRYENEITSEYAAVGIEEVTALIKDISQPGSIGPITDIYPKPQVPTTISITTEYISERLGVTLSDEEISALLMRLHIISNKSADGLQLSIPSYRLDLVSPQDIVEEVGRIYGYNNIPAPELSKSEFIPAVVKQQYFANQVRAFLAARGFSEVYTYSLTDKAHGEVELLNPFTSDKNVLRESLDEGLAKSLELNTRNAALLGLDEIKIFELGTVFTKTGEITQLGLGISIAKSVKKKDELTKKMLEEIRDALLSDFGTTVEGVFVGTDRYIVNFSELINELPTPKQYQDYTLPPVTKFTSISPYPFIVRDVAVFTNEGTPQEKVEEIIIRNAGPLLVRHSLFDKFEKTLPDGAKKISYGFRMVYQSTEKTLTDEEVNDIMNKITSELNTVPGWQVR